ncbi:hypothetical protein L198_07325 [Cryptococcus wingfieldii CBS 7118]|uniref:SET domain-containing protein n=1 Tax=Cryptococcus wingfieldii CBS 7118 TaxID=1295528 RepID=A0A1E3ICH9_9TREE|nr:hypothetical protein L198_07325 [Cryptococcus wingfieldii CBS 7118]ODN86307.1 hypothetical protein L198_07325 [Cryptococcus wingfieldii CBS 7118]
MEPTSDFRAPLNIQHLLRHLIPDDSQTKFLEGLQMASVRLGRETRIDERVTALMEAHMNKVFNQFIMQGFLAQYNPEGSNQSFRMNLQQAIEESNAAHREGNNFFYADPSSENTKIFSTVWEKVRCHQRSMGELKLVTGTDLKLYRTYEDCMILGKVITPVKSGLCLSFHIEDSCGAVFPVVIRFPTAVPHFSLSLPDTLAKLYPIGAILVIKSPRTGYIGGQRGITVDMPYEIEELHPNDPFLEGVKWQDGLKGDAPKGWKKYKDAGNAEMRKNNPLVAIRLYSLALSDPEVKSSPSKTFTLLLNRSKAYSTLNLHGHAYRDAHRAQAVIKTSSTTLTLGEQDRLQLQLAKAALGLRLYQTALDACGEASSEEEIRKTRERAQKRMEEQKSGVYDWMAIFRESLGGPLVDMDVGDYVSPAVKVSQVPGCGRGLIATQDITPGELIIVSKAIAPSRAKVDAPNVYVNCYDVGSQTHVPHETYMWVYRAQYKLHDEPVQLEDLASFSTDIHPSPPDDRTFDEEEDVRAECIFDSIGDGDIPYLPLNNFRQILKSNSFSGWSLPPKGEGLKGVDPLLMLKRYQDQADLLHGMPALLNHSCLPNTTRCWYGDMMVVRATKHISKGDELTTSYVAYEPSYSFRLSVLTNWNFTCACTLCQADSSPRDDPQRRDQIMDANMILLFTNPSLIGKPDRTQKQQQRRRAEDLEKLVRSVEATYSSERGQGTKGHLAKIYYSMGRSYFVSGQHPEAVKALNHFLEYAGVTLTTPAQERQTGRKVHESHYLEDEVIVGMLLLASMERVKALISHLPQALLLPLSQKCTTGAAGTSASSLNPALHHTRSVDKASSAPTATQSETPVAGPSLGDKGKERQDANADSTAQAAPVSPTPAQLSPAPTTGNFLASINITPLGDAPGPTLPQTPIASAPPEHAAADTTPAPTLLLARFAEMLKASQATAPLLDPTSKPPGLEDPAYPGTASANDTPPAKPLPPYDELYDVSCQLNQPSEERDHLFEALQQAQAELARMRTACLPQFGCRPDYTLTPHMSHHSTRLKPSGLPKLKGTSHKKVDPWIAQISALLCSATVTKSDVISFLPRAFKDRAMSWYVNLGPAKQLALVTWSDWQEAIRRQFLRANYAMKAQVECTHRQPRSS